MLFRLILGLVVLFATSTVTSDTTLKRPGVEDNWSYPMLDSGVQYAKPSQKLVTCLSEEQKKAWADIERDIARLPQRWPSDVETRHRTLLEGARLKIGRCRI